MDLATYTWKSTKGRSAVPSRVDHTASVIKKTIYIIGGRDSHQKINQENMVQVFDVRRESWSTPDISGNIPTPRSGHSAVTLGDDLFVFGGYTRTGLSNDLYRLDTNTFTWSHVRTSGSPPPPLAYHSCIPVSNSLMIMGGFLDSEESYVDLAVLVLAKARSHDSRTKKEAAVVTGKPVDRESYPMNNSPKGEVLIINVSEVHDLETGKIMHRPGSDVDRQCISVLFEDLGFNVSEYENVTLKQFSTAMEEFVKHAMVTEAQSVFLKLMSHGGTQRGGSYILAKDGYKIQIRDTVERYLSSSVSPRLALRPKVVLVQACQGTGVDRGVDLDKVPPVVEFDSPEEFQQYTANRVADFCNYYFGFATQPKRRAARNPGEGSWFLREINEVFRKKAATKHLSELMAEVRHNVSTKYGQHEGIIQTPEAIDGLNKPFYLFPGI